MTYHDLPILKPPVWTWEVPAYFFVGGAAGASAAVAAAAQLTGADRDLVRDARWIAFVGATASAPLLIMDLGRPERFLNMLRVFKPQSPMSVGAWTLAIFGGASTMAVFLPRRLGDIAALLSAATGLVMATYTGVLIGATAIPVWSENAGLLPQHFGASALSSAVALLELRGHSNPALNTLGAAAAAFETWTATRMRLRHDFGVLAAEIFSGPAPLVLRLLGIRSKRLRRAAAAASLLGSLLTRFAWIEAGKASSRDAKRALG